MNHGTESVESRAMDSVEPHFLTFPLDSQLRYSNVFMNPLAPSIYVAERLPVGAASLGSRRSESVMARKHGFGYIKMPSVKLAQACSQ